MAITYNAGTDTITVTAGTSGSPNTFTDIYNADVAGAWGQVTKTGNMFVFSAKLQVGDGSTATYLHDTFKKVTLNDIWTVKNNAELKTGIQSGGNPRKGCYLLLNTTAATAITVESGGTYYMYQTLSEDTGTGTNLLSGETEDFYRGAMAMDLRGSKSNTFAIGGLPETSTVANVTESIVPYYSTFNRRNPIADAWETYNKAAPFPPFSQFTTMHPGIGYALIPSADCCLIVDSLLDGDFYESPISGSSPWTGISNKYRFDIPAGGGGLMRNPPMTGGMV